MDAERIPVVDDVRGEDDTQPGAHVCVLCGIRNRIQVAIGRAGVLRITTVADYTRPSSATCSVESVRAMVCMPNGDVKVGRGHSREEAIVDALDVAGVKV